MLMAWGPHRFEVRNYSVEDMASRVSARVAHSEVIGRAPLTHLLGEGVDEIRLDSAFYPYHFNTGAFPQLRSVRTSVKDQTPWMLVHVSGRVFGSWIGESIDDEQTIFDTKGIPNAVTATLTLKRYTGLGGSFAGTSFFGLL